MRCWREMKSKWRYNVRLAQRRGVTVRRGDEADLAHFYRLYAETGRRDGFLIRPYDYYRATWAMFLRAEADPGNPAGGVVAAGRTRRRADAGGRAVPDALWRYGLVLLRRKQRPASPRYAELSAPVGGDALGDGAGLHGCTTGGVRRPIRTTLTMHARRVAVQAGLWRGPGAALGRMGFPGVAAAVSICTRSGMPRLMATWRRLREG